MEKSMTEDYKALIQQKLSKLRRERENVQNHLESLQKEENDLQVTLDVLAKFSKREDTRASVPRITLADRVLQILSNDSLTIRGIMEQIPDTIQQKTVSAVLSVLKKQEKVSNFKGVWSLVDRHSLKIQTPDLLGKLTKNNNEGANV
jgi:predicted Rossmann fold nucleotide-binding protein DprA/Smf involved in DNA uptake